MRPALEATPKSVPAVSKRLTKRKDIIILNIVISRAPIISNFRKTGEISGGKANTPSNFTRPKKILIKVTASIPIIIAPGVFLIERIDINKNPRPASNVGGFVKSPKLKNVAPLASMIPPFLSPIKPMNKPTPAPIAILRFIGMLSSIHLRKGVMLMIKNRTPAIKTDPKATSHEYPISPTTV